MSSEEREQEIHEQNRLAVQQRKVENRRRNRHLRRHSGARRNDQLGLGELTEPISNERKELEDYTLDTDPPIRADSLIPLPGSGLRIPPDIAQQAIVKRRQSVPARSGSIKLRAEVTSTFDARPINTIDHYIALNGTILFTEDFDPSPQPLSLSFTVPSSRVYVMREFRFTVTPFNTDLDLDELLFSILVNNTADEFYRDLELGQASGDFINNYIIADANNTVTFRFFSDYLTGGNVPDYTATIAVEARGNMILKTGRPPNFEPGNMSDIKEFALPLTKAGIRS